MAILVLHVAVPGLPVIVSVCPVTVGSIVNNSFSAVADSFKLAMLLVNLIGVKIRVTEYAVLQNVAIAVHDAVL